MLPWNRRTGRNSRLNVASAHAASGLHGGMRRGDCRGVMMRGMRMPRVLNRHPVHLRSCHSMLLLLRLLLLRSRRLCSMSLLLLHGMLRNLPASSSLRHPPSSSNRHLSPASLHVSHLPRGPCRHLPSLTTRLLHWSRPLHGRTVSLPRGYLLATTGHPLSHLACMRHTLL